MPKIPARVNITLTPQMVLDITTIQKSPYVIASASALCAKALEEGLHTQAAQIEKWLLTVPVSNNVCEPTQSVLTSTTSNEHTQLVQTDTTSDKSVQAAQPVQTSDGATPAAQLVQEITTCASTTQAAQPNTTSASHTQLVQEITTCANTPKPSLVALVEQAGEEYERDLKAKEPAFIPNDLTSMAEDRRIAAEADGTWNFPAPKLPERAPDVVVPMPLNYPPEAETRPDPSADSVLENEVPERPSEDPGSDEEDSDAKFFEDLDLDD